MIFTTGDNLQCIHKFLNALLMDLTFIFLLQTVIPEAQRNSGMNRAFSPEFVSVRGERHLSTRTMQKRRACIDGGLRDTREQNVAL